MVKTGCNWSGPLCGPTWTSLDRSRSGCLKSGKSKDRLRSGCLKIGAKDRTGPDFKTLPEIEAPGTLEGVGGREAGVSGQEVEALLAAGASKPPSNAFWYSSSQSSSSIPSAIKPPSDVDVALKIHQQTSYHLARVGQDWPYHQQFQKGPHLARTGQ